MYYICEITNTCGDAMFALCGDLNARTGTLLDFVEFDNTFNSLPDEYIPDTYIPRFSSDSTVNNNGVKLIDFCKSTGLRIVNGRKGNDEGKGMYTLFTYNGRSVVDYLVCSQELFPLIRNFDVGCPNEYSDHVCLSFCLSAEVSVNDFSSVDDFEAIESPKMSRYIWNEDKAPLFVNRLQSEACLKELDKINDILTDNSVINSDSIDVAVDTLNDVLYKAAGPELQRSYPKKCDVNNTHSSFLYNDEVEDKKHIFHVCLNAYRQNNSDTNRVNMVKARNAFRCAARRCRLEKDKQKTDRLLKARYKNAKEYWKLLKGCAGIKKCNIDISIFADYFSKVHNPDDPFFTVDEDIAYFVEHYYESELQVMFDELNVDITIEEINNAICSLNAGNLLDLTC